MTRLQYRLGEVAFARRHAGSLGERCAEIDQALRHFRRDGWNVSLLQAGGSLLVREAGFAVLLERIDWGRGPQITPSALGETRSGGPAQLSPGLPGGATEKLRPGERPSGTILPYPLLRGFPPRGPVGPQGSGSPDWPPRGSEFPERRGSAFDPARRRCGAWRSTSGPGPDRAGEAPPIRDASSEVPHGDDSEPPGRRFRAPWR